MKKKEHMDKIKYMESNPYIQIPSNLISEVTRAVRINNAESYAHYAFSFLILNAFLYKYANYINISDKTYINISDMKEILKYNAKNKKIDIISKRGNGILEQEGFIESSTDIPISYVFIDNPDSIYKKRVVLDISDVDDDLRNYIYSDILRTPNYFSYTPTFMMDTKKKEGTLNNYSKTFRLDYSEFVYFIFNDNFTLRDFYVYCYIKSSLKKDGIANITYDTYKRQTGLSKNTIKNIINKLEKEGIVDVSSSGNYSYKIKNPNKYKIKNDFKNYIAI